MTSDLIEAIASNIKIHTDNGIYAQAQIRADLIPLIESSSLKIKPDVDGDVLRWYGGDAIYTVEALWPTIQAKQEISLTFVQEYSEAWHKLQNTLSTLKIQKMLPNAVIPSRAHPLDSGFDITVIRIVKPDFGPGVVLFGTGLIVRPPDGYYVDMVARSST